MNTHSFSLEPQDQLTLLQPKFAKLNYSLEAPIPQDLPLKATKAYLNKENSNDIYNLLEENSNNKLKFLEQLKESSQNYTNNQKTRFFKCKTLLNNDYAYNESVNVHRVDPKGKKSEEQESTKFIDENQVFFKNSLNSQAKNSLREIELKEDSKKMYFSLNKRPRIQNESQKISSPQEQRIRLINKFSDCFAISANKKALLNPKLSFSLKSEFNSKFKSKLNFKNMKFESKRSSGDFKHFRVYFMLIIRIFKQKLEKHKFQFFIEIIKRGNTVQEFANGKEF